MKKNQRSQFNNKGMLQKKMPEISFSCGASIEPFGGPVPPEPTTRRTIRTTQRCIQRTAIVHTVPLEHLMNSVNNGAQCVKIESKYGMKKLAFKMALNLPQEYSIENKVKNMVVPVQISKITPVKGLFKRNEIGRAGTKAKLRKGRG